MRFSSDWITNLAKLANCVLANGANVKHEYEQSLNSGAIFPPKNLN